MGVLIKQYKGVKEEGKHNCKKMVICCSYHAEIFLSPLCVVSLCLGFAL